jgi:replicative DNA helicase
VKGPRRSPAARREEGVLGAEETLLGSVLLDSRTVPDVSAIVADEDWYRPQHRTIWRAIVELHGKHGVCDLAILLDHVQTRNLVEEVGGVSFLYRVSQAAPTPEFAVQYAQRVRGHALSRRVELAGREIAAVAGEGEREGAELVDWAEARLLEVTRRSAAASWTSASELAPARLAALRERIESPATAEGLLTGLEDLDRLTLGFRPGDLVILAARPSMGKSALALQIAQHAARSAGAVGFVSLEMTRDACMDRMLARVSGVSSRSIRTGQHIGPTEWGRLADAADELHGLRLAIDDTSALTVADVRGRARKLHAQEGGLALFVVDYLQLLQPPAGHRDSREAAVAGFTRGLKGLAKELGCPVLALAQVNRSCEAREDKRPRPSDLRESGAVEQDADCILFLYRDEVYEPGSPDAGLAEIIVAKQRDGETGTVKVAWLAQRQTFASLERRDLGGGYA